MGLARPSRPEAGTRTFPREMVQLIEGMALLKPPPSIATIHRRIANLAVEQCWRRPSYGSVRDIVRRIEPAMLTLAHEGAAASRDRFELVHRYRAARPNARWQADHTQLDILILDASGKKARSEEHTSELQSLMRISYAVFCLKKKNKNTTNIDTTIENNTHK